jgi:hypothetical protein
MRIHRSSVFVCVGTMAMTAWCCILTDADAAADAPSTVIEGINLPPKQEPTGNGAFSSEALKNDYTQDEVQGAVHHKKGIRIAVNPKTVSDETRWKNTRNMADWALQAGGFVVFCMWDSNAHDVKHDGHGDGLVDDPAAAKQMWITVARAYQDNPKVFFEAFNEPFGYKHPDDYVAKMKSIIPDNESIKIPHDRIILDGMGAAADVRSIRTEWDGLLGYHVYPNWIGDASKQRQPNYSNVVQEALAGVAHRTFVTEFGANLKQQGNYTDSNNLDANIQFLKGMDDAFNVVKPRATFLWHGLNNGDTYSYWTARPTAKQEVDAAQSYGKSGSYAHLHAILKNAPGASAWETTVDFSFTYVPGHGVWLNGPVSCHAGGTKVTWCGSWNNGGSGGKMNVGDNFGKGGWFRIWLDTHGNASVDYPAWGPISGGCTISNGKSCAKRSG